MWITVSRPMNPAPVLSSGRCAPAPSFTCCPRRWRRRTKSCGKTDTSPTWAWRPTWGSVLEIYVPSARFGVRVFLGAFEEFVELLFQYLAVRLFGLKLLLEELLAPVAGTFELGHFGGKILDRGRLYRNRLSNHGARLRIDLQNRIAARTCHVEHRFGHASIVVQIGVGKAMFDVACPCCDAVLK